MECAGICLSAGAFGVVYGLAARNAGLSLAETVAMSVFVFAGAAQFASVGLIAQAAPWPAILLLTALLNSRHLLYSAALLPWLRPRPARERAAMSYVLTDEAFALAIHHFRRTGRVDVPGYWLAAGTLFVTWNVCTIAGALGGQAIPDPRRFGIDVVFPAAMTALALLLIHGRRDLGALVAGVGVATVLGLAIEPAVGIVAGGLVGPLIAMLIVPGGTAATQAGQGATRDAGLEDAIEDVP